jgi:hypothetical protein
MAASIHPSDNATAESSGGTIDAPLFDIIRGPPELTVNNASVKEPPENCRRHNLARIMNEDSSGVDE